MQRKLEQLPGLSNVTGKYTKKCTEDTFPHLFPKNVEERRDKSRNTCMIGHNMVSSTPLSDSHFGSSSIKPDSKSCYTTANSDYSVNAMKVSMSKSHNSGSKIWPKSTSTSPSLVSSSHLATSKCRSQKSNIPVKPSELLPIRRNNNEVVKSSSSGSVSALNSKPTGVIIATPCSPRGTETTLARSFDSFPSSRNRTCLPHFAPKSTYDSYSGSVLMNDPIELTGVYTDDHKNNDKNVPASVEKIHVYKRHSCDKSIAFHPSYLPTVSRGTTSHADCQQQQWKRFSDGQDAMSADAFYVEHSDSCQQVWSLSRTDKHLESELPQCSSYPVSDVNYTWKTQTSDNVDHPNADSHLFLSKNQESIAEECTKGYTSNQYRLQPRHGSWGIGMPYIDSHRSLLTMPGPQCTQHALEHYLSDLLADENGFLTTFAQSGSFCVPQKDNFNQFDEKMSPTHQDIDRQNREFCYTDRLRFLEERIENALRNASSTNSKQHYPRFAVQYNRLRTNRSASLNPLYRPRWNYYETAVQPTNDPGVSTISSPIELSSPLYHPGPNLQQPCSYTNELDQNTKSENNMLQQFSTDELEYLLKAVKDLLVLRCRSFPNSTVTQDNLGACDVERQRKHSKSDRSDSQILSSREERTNQAINEIESHTTRSLSNSRSSSAARSNRSEVSSESRATRLVSTTSEDESNHSNVDLMHQRLPIGFQHFERYLDSKFGPDHPCRSEISNTDIQTKSDIHTKFNNSGCEYFPHSSSNNLPADNNNNNNNNLQPSLKDKTFLTAQPHMVSSCNGSSSSYKTGGNLDPSASGVLSQDVNYSENFKQSFTCTTLQSPGEDLNFSPPNMSSDRGRNRDEQTMLNDRVYTAGSNQPCISNLIQPTDSHLPVNNDFVPQLSPSYAYSGPYQSPMSSDYPIHQTALYNNDFIAMQNYCDQSQQLQFSCWPPQWYQWYLSSHMLPNKYSVLSQYPFYHYYLPSKQLNHFNLDHMTHSSRTNRFQSPVLFSNNTQNSHACCMDRQQMLHSTDGVYPTSTESSQNINFESRTSVTHQTSMENLSSVPIISCTCSNHETFRRFPFLGSYSYAERVPSNSYMFYRPSLTEIHSPPGAAYQWFPYTNNVRCNPHVYRTSDNHNNNIPYQRLGFPRYNNCMPRSGSANAGFTYSSPESADNPERSNVGADFERIRQNPNNFSRMDTCSPLFQSQTTNSCIRDSEQSVDAQNHVSQFNIASQPFGLRSMTNSFSAHDLAHYHQQNRFGLRNSKSSFELAPELPVEPGLILLDYSNFYSKISSLIEMDNNSRLLLPNGWSERRSSSGRTYYTCDSTHRSSWNHPRIGAYIPLGWERVDSIHSGIYYQNLLIPHCQRHHPNLWIIGPLKDPEIERKSFFTDLRKLQLSVRHQIPACRAEVEAYKNASTERIQQQYVNRFYHFNLDSLMEIIHCLDQLFYEELHSIVVSYEQERLNIVSHLFAMRPPEKAFQQFTDS